MSSDGTGLSHVNLARDGDHRDGVLHDYVVYTPTLVDRLRICNPEGQGHVYIYIYIYYCEIRGLFLIAM